MDKLFENYTPFNYEEEKDRELILELIRSGLPLLNRECYAHFTVSAIVLNNEKDHFLFVYHNIYDSWSWMGGHVDGDEDFRRVIIKEVREESGLDDVSFISDDILSVEVLPVKGHLRKGEYVSSHLHLNVTFLLEANSNAPLRIKPDENRGVAWFPLEQLTAVSNEEWFNEHIYSKLADKINIILKGNG